MERWLEQIGSLTFVDPAVDRVMNYFMQSAPWHYRREYFDILLFSSAYRVIVEFSGCLNLQFVVTHVIDPRHVGEVYELFMAPMENIIRKKIGLSRTNCVIILINLLMVINYA
jgi:hypothetical protein